MNSPSKSAQAARTSTPVPARYSPDGPAASAAVLLNAAVVGIAGLFSSTRSVLVTLIGFSITAVLTGWYLWVRRVS